MIIRIFYKNLANFNKLNKEMIILNQSIKRITNIIKLNIFSLKQIKII